MGDEDDCFSGVCDYIGVDFEDIDDDNSGSEGMDFDFYQNGTMALMIMK